RGGEATALTGHRGNVSAVAFSPNGRVLASAATHFAAAPFGGEVILWDTRTGQRRLALPWAEGGIGLRLAFHPARGRLATAHLRGSVKVWSVKQLLGGARPSR